MNKRFVPVKEEKEVISLRISTQLLDRLDAIATNYNISRNDLIIQSINFALKNMIEKDELSQEDCNVIEE